jgi:hypothetical protein
MLETPHVAFGMAIAVKTGNPYIAIPMALASHFVLDVVPHWNPHFYTETKEFGKPAKLSTTIALIDEFVAIGLTLYVAYAFLPNINTSLLILISSFLSVLPDQIKFPFFFFKNMRKGIIKKWTKWERSIQVEVGPFWGILNQIIVTVVSLFWIFT